MHEDKNNDGAPKRESKEEALHLLGRANNEIKSLRRRVEVLQAQVDVMDLFRDAIRPRGQGFEMSEDLACAIEKFIESETSE